MAHIFKNVILLTIGVVALLVAGIFFVRKPGENQMPQKIVRQCNYSFAELQVKEFYRRKPAAVDFKTNPKAEEFKTAIIEAAAQGPNFAGHYTIATWGCGTACQSSAIIDAATGAIREFGILSARGLKFEASSTLLLVNPVEYPQGNQSAAPEDSVVDYYQMKEDGLEFLCKKPFGFTKPFYECEKSPKLAENPLTEEREIVSALCDAPSGWKISEPPREPTP